LQKANISFLFCSSIFADDIILAMFPLVVIDLETTGLEPQKDAILEIGAVRYDPAREPVTFQQLINPGRLVPPVITQLTGITNEDIRTAPTLQAILPGFIEFVGDDPVVGQNVRFDLEFLQDHNALIRNKIIDTRELGAVLLPRANRYSLGALAEHFEIEMPEEHRAHRALDDARMTLAVFLRLYQAGQALPMEMLDEITQLCRGLDWDGRFFFTELLRERSKQPVSARRTSPQGYGQLFNPPRELQALTLKPNEEVKLMDVDETAALLEHGGAFETFFTGKDGRPKFESRPQQLDMLRAVTTAINKGRHMLIEAGTGIGKSFAYLLPAATWATSNNQRVVISTNTINLQDQLLLKDIPDLKSATGLDLRAVVLKGRSNYLCPRRLEALRHRGPQNVDELRVLAKTLVWLQQGGNGDRSQITLSGPLEGDVWVRLSAEDETCNMEVCQSRMGGICPYFQARQAAQGAHLIVVNHALLLADVITNNKVLPDYTYLIVDEAHHLESATTGALSYRVTNVDINRMMNELGGAGSGTLGVLLKALSGRLNPAQLAECRNAIDYATDLAFQVENSFQTFFRTLAEFLEQEREGQAVSDYGQQVRITTTIQHLPAWTLVDIAWDETGKNLNALLQHLTKLQREISDVEHGEDETLEELLSDLNSILRRLGEVLTRVSALVAENGSETINWVEMEPRPPQRVSLNVAPLHIGSLMEKYVWHEKDSVILTSATLTADGEFNYLRGRLNADEADELVLGSPFDYENSTLLFIPNDMPEPVEYAQYQKWVERTLLRLGKATGGRMLALFTSYKQLKLTAAVISPLLAEAGIRLYEQGEGASSTTLLESFRNAGQAVLFGTRSFWEGVDVPGEKLSVLAIVKLPFDVPSDPIVAARAETFENPFEDYNLPEAILRFRQGFGRLIRTQSDRGVVALLDRRVLTKKYGQQFLHSLPQCTQRIAPVEELPAEAKKWLGL